MTKSSKAKLEYQADTGVILKNGKPTGTVGTNGYVVLRVDGKVVYAHRLAWELHHGEVPKCIDHINGDRTDNRIANLRSVEQRVNSENTTHGRGMHFHKPSKRWKSAITVAGRQVHLGYFNTPEDANECYTFAKSFFHNSPRMQHA